MSAVAEFPVGQRSTLGGAARIESLREHLRRLGTSDFLLAYGLEKYGEPFLLAEKVKLAMRRQYAEAMPRSRSGDFDGAVRERDNALSREFWAAYEEVNRRLIPEDPVFTGTRAGVTLATTADLWTLSVGSAGQCRVLESYIGGESGASTVLRFAIQRATGGTTPTNQTPEKANTRSPAAVNTFATTWAAQPTLSGVALLFHAFNTFGGTDRWIAQPGGELFLVNSEILSGRSASGTPVVSSHLIWEEL